MSVYFNPTTQEIVSYITLVLVPKARLQRDFLRFLQKFQQLALVSESWRERYMNRIRTRMAPVASAIVLAVLANPLFAQEAAPENNAPSVGGINPQTVDEGKVFEAIKLDQFVSDPEDKPATIEWTATGAKELVVTIANRVATIKIPNKDWNGREEITFTAKDPKGAMGSQTVSFEVQSINDAPTLKPIAGQTIDEGKSFQPIALDQFIVDIDHPANQIQWSVDVVNTSKVKAPQGGDIAIEIDGSRNAKIVIPDTNWFGSAKATFTATDAEGASVTTVANFEVKSVNDAPLLQAIPEQIIEEGGEFQSIHLPDLASDADHEIKSLKWSIVGGSFIKASIDKSNTLSFKAPSMDWNGPVENFVVTVEDPLGGKATVKVLCTVKSVNDIPELKTIPGQTIDEGKLFTAIELDKFVSDLDHRFDQLKWEFKGAKNLKLQQAGTRLNIAVIDTNWFGEESIKFTVTDPENGKAEGEVMFTVRSVNDLVSLKPIAGQTIAEGKTFVAIPLDNFVSDGDHAKKDLQWETSIKVTKASKFGEPSVSLDNDRNLRFYLPDTNYNGAFTVTLNVADPEGSRATQTAAFEVTSVNDVPVLKATADQTIEEGNEFTAVNLDELVFDADHETPTLKWVVTGQQNLLASIDKNRVLTVKAPAPDYFGATETLTLTVTDAEGGAASIRVKFTIKSVNDEPEMKEIASQSIAEGKTFAPIDLDKIVSDRDHGVERIKWTFTGNKQLKIRMEGRVANVVAPDSNWNGEETITFTATDPEGAKAERTASFAIQSINDIPVLRDFPEQTIAEGRQFTPIKLDEMVQDLDHKDDQIAWETAVAVQKGQKGQAALSVQIDASRIARVIIPDTNWYGSEVITFTATDPEGGRAVKSVVYTVTSVNDAPRLTKIPDQTIDEGADFATIVLDDYVTDVDHQKAELNWTVEGGNLLTINIDKNRNATVRIPNKDWFGAAETFRFTVTDKEGAQASTQLKLLVNPVNDAPNFKDVPGQRIKEGQSFQIINLQALVTDIDNTPQQHKWTIKGNKQLLVKMDASNVVTITAPDTNWHGEESVSFSVFDGLTTVEKTALFEVQSVNDIPALKPIAAQTIDEGKAFAKINLNDLVSDSDHKTSELTWSIESAPVGGKKGAIGMLSITQDKGFATIAAPDTNWNGAEVITFTVTDPEGGKATAQANFTVNSINDIPVFKKIPAQTIEEKSSFQPIALAELISDSDHEISKLKITFAGNKDLKVALDKGLNAVVTTPSNLWNGAETIVFTVLDPEGGKAEQSVLLTVKSVNDLPELATLKSQSIDEGKEFVPVPLDALVKDADHAKDQLTWSVKGNKQLQATISPERVLTVKAPNADWNGMEALTLTVVDPDKGSASSEATFEIKSVNDLPVLKEIPSQSIDEGKKFATIKLTDLVSDVDHKVEELQWEATVAVVGNAKSSVGNLTVDIQKGVATISIPDTNWNGERKITFTVTDPMGGKATASAMFVVKSINDLPVIAKEIQGKSMSVNEDVAFNSLSLESFVSDSDHENKSLKWEVTGAKDLKVVLDKDHNLNVTVPHSEWAGKETLVLTITDPEGGKAQTNLSYEVKAVNDAPVLQVLSAQTIKEGETFKSIALDALVKDPDHKATEMVWKVTGNKALKAEITSERVLNVTTPDVEWNGDETLTLQVKDPAGASVSIDVPFSVQSVNDIPVLSDIPEMKVNEGQKFKDLDLASLVKDVDHKVGELTWNVQVAASPKGVTSNLLAEITGTKLTIAIPDSEWAGDRSVTVTVTDPMGGKATKTFKAIVVAVNDAPILAKVPNQEAEEGGKFALLDLNGLVTDIDDVPARLNFTVEGNKALKASIMKGVLTVSTPDADWSGSETLTISVMDPAGAKASQDVVFNVKPVNDAPVLSNMPGQIIDEGKNFELLDVASLVKDVDNKAEELVWTHTEKTLKVEFNKAKQAFRFLTPDSNWYGSDTVTFTVTDPAKASMSKSAVFTVKPVNDLPLISPIADQTIDEGKAFAAIAISKQVKDADDALTALKYSIDDGLPSFLDAKGKPTKSKPATTKHSIRFTMDDEGNLNAMVPDADWNGSDSVIVNVFDPQQAKASTKVRFIVKPVNDAPVIVGKLDDQTIDEGKAFAPIKLDALIQDVDDKAHELTWKASGDRSLEVSITSGREALIKPKRHDWNGQERITLTVKDKAGASAQISATYTVKHVNAVPVLSKIPDQTINEDATFKPISMDDMASDKDHGKSQLRWEVTGNKELEVTIDRVKGQIVIKTPREHFNGGPEVLTFKVTDPEGAVATTTANFNVLPVNDNPVAMGQSYTTREGEALNVNAADGLLKGASDPDGDRPTEAIIVERTTNGTLTARPDGSFSYVPKAGFNGVDEFTFKIRDKQGATSNVERAEINVQFKMGELRAPTAQPKAPDPKAKKGK